MFDSKYKILSMVEPETRKNRFNRSNPTKAVIEETDWRGHTKQHNLFKILYWCFEETGQYVPNKLERQLIAYEYCKG